MEAKGIKMEEGGNMLDMDLADDEDLLFWIVKKIFF